MTASHKEIPTFIDANIMGCHFVGISEENEVFVEHDHDDPELQFAAALKIMDEFKYVIRVTKVVRPSLEEAQEMLDGLNKYLDDDPQAKKDRLLDIGEF